MHSWIKGAQHCSNCVLKRDCLALLKICKHLKNLLKNIIFNKKYLSFSVRIFKFKFVQITIVGVGWGLDEDMNFNIGIKLEKPFRNHY